jgi:hypothetical protein
MRVFGRVLVLAGLLCLLAPATAGAVPILTGVDRKECDGIAAAASLAHCSLFDIGSPAEATLAGSFSAFEDVALFRFSVSGLASFTAGIANGFDGFLGLFDGDTAALESVTYFNSEAEGNVPAQGVELGTQTAPIALGTEAGRVYILALVMGFNGFTIGDGNLDSLREGFSADSFVDLQGPCLDAAACSYSVAFTSLLTEQPQPVPEPGTLVLFGSGMLAAVARARAKKRV